MKKRRSRLLRQMMGVFNNLVIYGQDVPKPVGIGDPDLPTAGHGMRKAIAFGTASKYLGCLKVKTVVRGPSRYR